LHLEGLLPRSIDRRLWQQARRKERSFSDSWHSGGHKKERWRHADTRITV